MELDCPRCSIGKLEEIEVDGILIDRCRVCGGLWFDSGELTQVSGDAAAVKNLEAQMPSTQVDLECPRCEKTALRSQALCVGENSSCAIYRCPSCLGSWIDRGVLRLAEDKRIAQNTRECFAQLLERK
ncbi:MAG: zf-TFIIB domain-containing protein [Deltaproteobacteria bacterium]|nr:zf-TFIIB domain-containing protein [Deltaproteobacteria bacterium]